MKAHNFRLLLFSLALFIKSEIIKKTYRNFSFESSVPSASSVCKAASSRMQGMQGMISWYDDVTVKKSSRKTRFAA
jgi:hypothetical protein